MIGAQVELIRAIFPNFAKDVDPSTLTPEQVHMLILELDEKNKEENENE